MAALDTRGNLVPLSTAEGAPAPALLEALKKLILEVVTTAGMVNPNMLPEGTMPGYVMITDEAGEPVLDANGALQFKVDMNALLDNNGAMAALLERLAAEGILPGSSGSPIVKLLTKILYGGDSHIEGYLLANPSQTRWIDVLQGRLDLEKFLPYASSAVTGETIAQQRSKLFTLLGNIDHAAHPQSILYVEPGSNDISTGRVAEQIRADRKEYISAARTWVTTNRPGHKLIVILASIARNGKENQGVSRATFDAIRKTINDADIVDYKTYSGADYYQNSDSSAELYDTYNTAYYNPDRQHINEAGNVIEANLAQPIILAAAAGTPLAPLASYSPAVVTPPAGAFYFREKDQGELTTTTTANDTFAYTQVTDGAVGAAASDFKIAAGINGRFQMPITGSRHGFFGVSLTNAIEYGTNAPSSAWAAYNLDNRQFVGAQLNDSTGARTYLDSGVVVSPSPTAKISLRFEDTLIFVEYTTNGTTYIPMGSTARKAAVPYYAKAVTNFGGGPVTTQILHNNATV